MIEKSKRVETDLNRWEKIVDKNKKEQGKRVEESMKLIQEWNDKLSNSSSHKELRVNKNNSLARVNSKKSFNGSIEEEN